MKTRKRWVSLLVTVAMLAALIVPVVAVGPAYASSTYTVSSVTTLSSAYSGSLDETVLITVDTSVAQAAYGSVVLDLPSTPSGFTAIVDNVTFNAGGAYKAGDVAIAPGVGNAAGEFTVTVSGHNGPATADNTIIYVHLSNIVVPGGFSGDVTLTASSPGGLFSSGSLVIATVGSGKVGVAAESVASGTDTIAVGTIDVKETQAGSFDKGSSSVKLTLPNGFTWEDPAAITPVVVWGTFKNAAGVALGTSPVTLARDTNDYRVLKLNLNKGYSYGSNGAFLRLNSLIIDIDPSIAKAGDVTATVGGDSTLSTSSFVIGHYGELGLTVNAVSAPSLIAGQANQKTGELAIDENTIGSIVKGRTVTLTLPSDVVWSDTTENTPAKDYDLSSGDDITFAAKYIGSDGSVLRLTFNNASTSTAAKVIVKSLKVTPGVDFTGDLAVTLGGSLGATGTVVLGKVSAPVTATATSKDVQLGAAGQAVGDVTITEGLAGAISSSITALTAAADGSGDGHDSTVTGKGVLKLTLPAGVTFASTPKVAVTAGDLLIDSTSVATNTDQNNAGYLTFKITGASTTPSTITISGISVTVDRTVPVGPIALKVKGSAVDQTHPWKTDGISTDGTTDLFTSSSTAAKVAIANVTTALNGLATGTAVFKIGSASYTLNGTSVTVDAAPYIKDSRTFLPLRFIANALGVADSNIIYDSGKVTIIKGDRVIQLTIGSKVMLINGAAITMDTAPEITSGRTFLPVAWVAQALGASIVWDGTAQTVTITY